MESTRVNYESIDGEIEITFDKIITALTNDGKKETLSLFQLFMGEDRKSPNKNINSKEIMIRLGVDIRYSIVDSMPQLKSIILTSREIKELEEGIYQKIPMTYREITNILRKQGKIDSHLALRKFIIDNGYNFDSNPRRKEMLKIDSTIRYDIVDSIPKLRNYLISDEEIEKNKK